MSNRLTIAGIGVLGLAIVGVMLLICACCTAGRPQSWREAAAGAIFGVLWVALPLRERGEPTGRPAPDSRL